MVQEIKRDTLHPPASSYDLRNELASRGFGETGDILS